jgi:hypothetical protein
MIGQLVSLSLLVVTFSCVYGSDSSSRSISVVELKTVLKSEDGEAIVRAMNRVKRDQESKELMTFMTDLWRNDHQKIRDVPWSAVNDPLVKIEIANVLAQAGSNGYATVDRGALREYARSVVNRSDIGPKPTAVLTLGILGDPADIELLKNVALEENAQTFRAAVISLAKICDKRAEHAISDIGRRSKRPENQRFAKKPLSELAPFKRCS